MLATPMIPIQATIIPVFVLITHLQLADTFTSLIVPAWPSALGFFLLRQNFKQMPKEYEEAALLDGASHWRIFTRIYVPQVRPTLLVLAVLSFNAHWSEFFRPLIFLSSPEKFTLRLGLVNLQGYRGSGNVSVVTAGVALSILPVLVVYSFAQKYLIQGIMNSGVKG